MPPETILLTLAILFAAGLMKTMLGFGESLLTLPLLLLVLDTRIASPLVALIVSVLTTLILLRDWRQINFRSSWRVMAAGAVGVPFGVWGLSALPARWITLALGILLVLVGAFYMLLPAVRWVPGLRWGYLFGFFSGLLGGAFTTGGPPVVIYATLRRLPPDEFRATLQGWFTPLNMMVLAAHAAAGLWTAPVLELFGLALPGALIALWLGSTLKRFIPDHSFERIVYTILVLLGVVMVWRAVMA
jgi:uncharacterized membrane protein YfcA